MPSPTLTAVGVAALRALYTSMPGSLAMVADPLAARLLPGPLRAATALVRGRPTLGRLAHYALRALSADLSLSSPLRTVAIDEALRSAVHRGTSQVVLLGSGLDARAWRCPELAACEVFELDRPASHQHKRARLRQTPSLARKHAFVAIELERDSIPEALAGAGFRPDRPTVWLWEGVIIYLSAAAIRTTVEQLTSVSAAGSTLLATYTRPGLGAGLYPTLHLRAIARAVGEPVRGEISTPALHALLQSFGWQVSLDAPVRRWAERCLPTETVRGPEWERFLVCLTAHSPLRHSC